MLKEHAEFHNKPFDVNMLDPHCLRLPLDSVECTLNGASSRKYPYIYRCLHREGVDQAAEVRNAHETWQYLRKLGAHRMKEEIGSGVNLKVLFGQNEKHDDQIAEFIQAASVMLDAPWEVRLGTNPIHIDMLMKRNRALSSIIACLVLKSNKQIWDFSKRKRQGTRTRETSW